MNREDAIKKYCLWCMNGSKHEVELCPSTDCPLYPSRKGQAGGRKLEAIKARCEDCTEGLVRNCDFEDCQLYKFRNG